MSDNDKKYWHELSQEDIDALATGHLTWQDIVDAYAQPDWCNYLEALGGRMGCWSLTDTRHGGLRTKISEDYCKNCDCFIKKSPA